VIKQEKWNWEGRVARMNDNRWTKTITDWHPYNNKRSKKRSDSRWREEIERFVGIVWQRIGSYGRIW